MNAVPGRKNGWPAWLAVALLLAMIFTAVHGIAGLVTGSVLVPGSHGQHVTSLSDSRTYDLAEVFWLIGAAVFGISGVSMARISLFRKASPSTRAKR